jgi:hypothetical protein
VVDGRLAIEDELVVAVWPPRTLLSIVTRQGIQIAAISNRPVF